MLALFVIALMTHSTQSSQTTLAALEAKSQQLIQAVQEEHLREGLVIPTTIHVTRGNPAYTSNSLEDVCSRTGEYVQAESFRYAVTRSPEARTNASRSAMALVQLEKVTGVPGAFARCFKRGTAPTIDEESYFFPEEWHQSTAMPAYRWLGDPSVDQLNDWVIGLTTFYDLAATPEEKKRVRGAMSRVMGRILTHRMRITDVDGKMTLWGNLSPSLPHESLNSLLALSDLLCAYRVTREPRFLHAYHTLIRKHRYAEDAVMAKIFFPEWGMNTSDDNLAMEALDRLLTYETDPAIRDLYLASLRRYWTVLQYAHIPFYDLIVEHFLGGGLDARSLDYLVNYAYRGDRRVEQRRTQEGPITIEGTWYEAPYAWLRAYWYMRFRNLDGRAAALREAGTPARPDAPKFTRPNYPPLTPPPDLDAMVKVPGGPFVMGSAEGDPDEGPVRTVTLPTFWIDKYLVTNMQFKRFDPSYTFPPGEELAPARVTWQQADAYARRAGKRLPTEAEWEKAARGTDGRMFPWGNIYDITLVAWDDGDPVGRVTACVSPYGCVDMVGNVWQWTADWYGPYPGSTFRNAAMGKRFKTLRGGASFADRSFTRCAHRYYASPDSRVLGYYTGFRCVRDTPP